MKLIETEYIFLDRAEISAREAYELVAPFIARKDDDFRLVSITSGEFVPRSGLDRYWAFLFRLMKQHALLWVEMYLDLPQEATTSQKISGTSLFVIAEDRFIALNPHAWQIEASKPFLSVPFKDSPQASAEIVAMMNVGSNAEVVCDELAAHWFSDGRAWWWKRCPAPEPAPADEPAWFNYYAPFDPNGGSPFCISELNDERYTV